MYAQQFPSRPPAPTDEIFSVDEDAPGIGLDENCSFDDVVISVPVTRYMGPTDSSGYLSDPQALITSGVISATAKIRLPCLDIDLPSELDQIYINGRRIEDSAGNPIYLQGANGVYNLNEFEVPISWIRFPSGPGSAGAAPIPQLNEIYIDVDTGPGGPGQWCMSVDWATISIKTLHPILLVHGVLSSGQGCWEEMCSDAGLSPFVVGLAPVTYSSRIDLGGTSDVRTNARLLATLVADRAREFGAQSVHLVAHSKGGLECRAYLCDQTLYNPGAGSPRVLSLSTIASPHWGSAAADWIFRQIVAIAPFSPATSLVALWQMYPALSPLTSSKAAALNSELGGRFPWSIKVFSYSGNADSNADRALSSTEASCLNVAGYNYGDRLHRIVGNTSVVIVQRVSGGFVVPQPPSGDVFQRNDSLVAEFSAQFPDRGQLTGRFNGRNHVTVHDSVVAGTVLGNIRSAFPIQN